ncbi:hypothetical protein HZS_7893 [Henneguya salminicola]|nr:hypothetical protein HZS_7893 [Henneguya salminicola]
MNFHNCQYVIRSLSLAMQSCSIQLCRCVTIPGFWYFRIISSHWKTKLVSK